MTRNLVDVRLTIPQRVLDAIRRERCYAADGRSFDLILLRNGRQALPFRAALRGSGPTEQDATTVQEEA